MINRIAVARVSAETATHDNHLPRRRDKTGLSIQVREMANFPPPPSSSLCLQPMTGYTDAASKDF
jgi:hypothetical protein